MCHTHTHTRMFRNTIKRNFAIKMFLKHTIIIKHFTVKKLNTVLLQKLDMSVTISMVV